MIVFLTLLLCLVVVTTAPAQGPRDPAEGLVYLTEDMPPYNYTENGQATGLSVMILRLMWKRMGVPEQPIHFMPWPRVYQSAQMDSGVLALSAFRTEEREGKFKWVGPITSGRLSVFALSASNVSIGSFQDLKRYRIGAIRDLAATALVQQPGFRLTVINRTPTSLRMLESGRIEVLALDDKTFYSNVREMGYPPGFFRNVWILRTEDLYYFLSPDTPDELVARFQEALDAVKMSPEYRNLLNRYLN